MRVSHSLLVLIALGLATALIKEAAAQEKKPTQRPTYTLPFALPTDKTLTLDGEQIRRWLVRVVIDASQKGTASFRDGRYQECYQFYDSTLALVIPWITDPALQERVRTARLVAALETSYDRAAVYLRAALNDIRNRNDLHEYERGKPVERPLFERLGGREAVMSIVKMSYDKANDKDSGVNLDRNGEYPYTSARAQRMQKATVDLIYKLSKERAKAKQPKVDFSATETFKVLKKELTQKRDDALAKLATLPPKTDKAIFDAVVTELTEAQKRLESLSALAVDEQSTDVENLKKTHRTMRLTDEEYAAVIRILRTVLEQHAIPEQETEELIQVVETLRESLIADPH